MHKCFKLTGQWVAIYYKFMCSDLSEMYLSVILWIVWDSWFHALKFFFYHLICCNIFTTLGSHNFWICLYNIPQHSVFGLCPSSSVYKYKNLNFGILEIEPFSIVCWRGRTLPQAWQVKLFLTTGPMYRAQRFMLPFHSIWGWRWLSLKMLCASLLYFWILDGGQS